MTTLAPASASASTQASPIAWPPPVTTAILPSRRSFSRYMVDPSVQLQMRSAAPASAAQGAAGLIEAMDAVGLRRQPYMIAGLDAKLAGGPRRNRADVVDVDVDEGV